MTGVTAPYNLQSKDLGVLANSYAEYEKGAPPFGPLECNLPLNLKSLKKLETFFFQSCSKSITKDSCMNRVKRNTILVASELLI